MDVGGVRINGLSSFDTVSAKDPKDRGLLDCLDGVIDDFGINGITLVDNGISIFITAVTDKLDEFGGENVHPSLVRRELRRIAEETSFTKMTLGYNGDEKLIAIVMHNG